MTIGRLFSFWTVLSVIQCNKSYTSLNLFLSIPPPNLLLYTIVTYLTVALNFFLQLQHQQVGVQEKLLVFIILSHFSFFLEKKKDSMFFFLSLKKNSTSLSPFFRNLHTTENGFQSTEATPTSLPYCLPYNYRRGRKKINTHVHCQIHYYHLCFIILFFNLDLKSRNEANEFMSSALREWSTINYILLQHNSIKRFVLFYDKLKRFSFSISLIYSLSCFKSAMAALAMLDSGVPNGSWMRTCTASFKKTSASLSSFMS